jgi:Ca2+/Na+ antiporter
MNEDTKRKIICGTAIGANVLKFIIVVATISALLKMITEDECPCNSIGWIIILVIAVGVTIPLNNYSLNKQGQKNEYIHG